MGIIKLNKNQCQVLAVLFYNKKAGKNYMASKQIKEQCGFEKNATTTGCLQGLAYAGLVESKNQELLDGSIMKFFFIPDEVMGRLTSIVTFEED